MSNSQKIYQMLFLQELAHLFERYGAQTVVPAITEYNGSVAHPNNWGGEYPSVAFIVGSTFAKIGRVAVVIDYVDDVRNKTKDYAKIAPTYQGY